MKKLFAMLAVCGFAFAFVACGGQKTDNTAQDVDSAVVAPEEPVIIDSVDEAMDTTGAAMDTTGL